MIPQNNYSQKDTLRKLHYSLNQLREAAELAKLGSWEYDVVTGIIRWSDVTRAIHEVGPDFVPTLENTLGFYEEGRSREKVTALLSDVVENGGVFEADLQLLTSTGKRKWVSSRWKSEVVSGKCVRVFVTVQDIEGKNTERGDQDRISSKMDVPTSETDSNLSNSLNTSEGNSELDVHTSALSRSVSREIGTGTEESTVDREAIFAEKLFLENLMDDTELAVMVAEQALTDLKMRSECTSNALEVGDPEELGAHFHSIKGIAANCYCNRLKELVSEMESKARRGDIDHVRSKVPQVFRAIEEVSARLNSFNLQIRN